MLSESRMNKLARLNADGVQARILLGTASYAEIVELQEAPPLGVVDCEQRSRYSRVGGLCSRSVVSFARSPSSVVSVGSSRYRSIRSHQVAGRPFVRDLQRQAQSVNAAQATLRPCPKAAPAAAAAMPRSPQRRMTRGSRSRSPSPQRRMPRVPRSPQRRPQRRAPRQPFDEWLDGNRPWGMP